MVADLGSGRHDGKVVDGDATTRDAGFATLRCTDHLVVDLEALLIGLFAAVRPAPGATAGRTAAVSVLTSASSSGASC